MTRDKKLKILLQKEFQPTVYASSQCCMFRQPLSGLFGLKKKFVKRGRRKNGRTELKCKFFSFFKLFFFFFFFFAQGAEQS